MIFINSISSIDSTHGGTSTAVTALHKVLSSLYRGSIILTMSSMESRRSFGLIQVLRTKFALFDYVRYFTALYRVTRRKDAVVIFHGLWSIHLWPCMLYCIIRRIPYLVYLHGMLSQDAFSYSRHKKIFIWKLFLANLVSNANAVIVNSENELIEANKINASLKYRVIPNVVDSTINRFYKYSNKNLNFPFQKKILYIGRLHCIKRVECCIELFRRLNIPNSCLLIVGGGDQAYENKLRSIIESNLLADKVFLLGPLSPDDRDYLLSCSDLLLLLSIRENFGMVVPEALRFGLGIVSSAGTPWSELEYCELGVEIKDPLNLLDSDLDRVRELVDARDLNITSFRNRARMFLSRYDPKKIASEIESILNH